MWLLSKYGQGRGGEPCLVVPMSPVLGAATKDTGDQLWAVCSATRGFKPTLVSALTTSLGQGNFSFPAFNLLAAAGSNVLFIGIREGGGQLRSQGKGGGN